MESTENTLSRPSELEIVRNITESLKDTHKLGLKRLIDGGASHATIQAYSRCAEIMEKLPLSAGYILSMPPLPPLPLVGSSINGVGVIARSGFTGIRSDLRSDFPE